MNKTTNTSTQLLFAMNLDRHIGDGWVAAEAAGARETNPHVPDTVAARAWDLGWQLWALVASLPRPLRWAARWWLTRPLN